MEHREASTNERLKTLMLNEKGKVMMQGSVLSNLFLTVVMTLQTNDQRDTIQDAFRILAKVA